MINGLHLIPIDFSAPRTMSKNFLMFHGERVMVVPHMYVWIDFQNVSASFDLSLLYN